MENHYENLIFLCLDLDKTYILTFVFLKQY